MARGWESKAVEDQVASAESERASRGRPTLTDRERARLSHLQGLKLSRAKILHDLQSASNGRHRAMLQQALAHLDREIDGVDRGDYPIE